MIVTLVAMMGKNRVIGDRGRVPWHIPEDMKRFRSATMGHPVVMGRKTWETLKGPLTGRENVVITRHEGYRASGARVARDLEEALAPYRPGPGEVFVVGGAEIFHLALPIADKICLTVVEESPRGDAFFPELPEGDFRETSREPRPGPPPHAFFVLERSRPAATVGLP